MTDLSVSNDVVAIVGSRRRGFIRQYRALVAHQLWFMWRSKEPLILIFVVPIIAIALTKRLFAPLLHIEGHVSANGTEQSVPGMAIFFCLYLPTFLSISMYKEHVWGTWSRLRALAASNSVFVLGQVSPWIAVALLQQMIILVAGIFVFGMSGGERVWLAGIPCVLYILCCAAIGLLLYVLCNDISRIAGLANIIALVMGGTAGILVPLAALPTFVGWVGRLFPPYWAFRAYQYTIFGGNSLRNFVFPVFILVGYATLLIVAAWSALSRNRQRWH